MDRKQTLIHLRQETARLIQDFCQGLTVEEKAVEGTLENWSIKNILYHIGLWDQRLVETIQAALAGSPQKDYSLYLKINDQDFCDYQEKSWPEAEEILQSSNQSLLQALEAISDEQVESVDFLQGSEGRPAWNVLAGLMLGHPVLHLTEYLVRQGRTQAALQIMLEFTEAERGLDGGDRWQGLATYNQACYYALAGHKQVAKEKLVDALRLNPEMEEWSKSDPDLASLRE